MALHLIGSFPDEFVEMGVMRTFVVRFRLGVAGGSPFRGRGLRASSAQCPVFWLLVQSMSLAVVHSRALDGLKAPEVTIEVHLANGLPSFTLVGLADTEVKEAKERVRAALTHSGLEFPYNKRITVNMARLIFPRSQADLTCPLRWAFSRPWGRSTPPNYATRSSRANCLGGELRPIRGPC